MFNSIINFFRPRKVSDKIPDEIKQEVRVEQEIDDDVRIVLDSPEFHHVTKLKKAYAKLPDGYEKEKQRLYNEIKVRLQEQHDLIKELKIRRLSNDFRSVAKNVVEKIEEKIEYRKKYLEGINFKTARNLIHRVKEVTGRRVDDKDIFKREKLERSNTKRLQELWKEYKEHNQDVLKKLQEVLRCYDALEELLTSITKENVAGQIDTFLQARDSIYKVSNEENIVDLYSKVEELSNKDYIRQMDLIRLEDDVREVTENCISILKETPTSKAAEKLLNIREALVAIKNGDETSRIKGLGRIIYVRSDELIEHYAFKDSTKNKLNFCKKVGDDLMSEKQVSTKVMDKALLYVDQSIQEIQKMLLEKK